MEALAAYGVVVLPPTGTYATTVRSVLASRPWLQVCVLCRVAVAVHATLTYTHTHPQPTRRRAARAARQRSWQTMPSMWR